MSSISSLVSLIFRVLLDNTLPTFSPAFFPLNKDRLLFIWTLLGSMLAVTLYVVFALFRSDFSTVEIVEAEVC